MEDDDDKLSNESRMRIMTMMNYHSFIRTISQKNYKQNLRSSAYYFQLDL